MRLGMVRFAVVAAAALLGAQAAAPIRTGAGPISRTVYLMGTRATLTVFDDARDRALARLDLLLEALETTEAELSTWRADSELSRLNATPPGEPFHLSDPLCRTLADVQRWVAMTGGAFDPAVKRLIDAWRLRSDGATPDAAVLDRARRASGFAHIRVDARACVAARTADATLDAGGFGKGEALDRAAAGAGVDAPWLVDLGGQVMVSGAPPGSRGWEVDVAHPRRRDAAALELAVRAGSLATSGGSERDRWVDGVRIGHILDPRTGRPARFAGSVTVWHERALAADAVSTALYVMGPDEGLAWADAHGIAAVFLEADTERGPLAARASRAFVEKFGASLR